MTLASFIIPTNRSREVIEPCLRAIARQQCDVGELEVLVVFNGVDEIPTWEPGTWPFELVVDRIDKANICAAKNVALDRARGEWVFFINDDVVIEPDFVTAHLAAHERLDRPAMVLGKMIWRTYPDETLFDRMVQTTSMVFFYDRMTPREWYGFRHAWNLNLSLRRRYLKTLRFEDRLEPVNFDDLELAFRLERQFDLGVWYEPEAVCVHDHRYTLEGYLRREALLGRVSTLLWRYDPDCYRAIYGADLDEAYIEYCRRFLKTEGRFEDERIARLQALVSRPSREVATSDATLAELVQALYDGHVPLKRLAFRRGLLDAVSGNRAHA
ncbi:MAG: glycosyltransferase [Phycisphaerae bacterium]|nr:glycosyltransferase [Phycisphaerae bacterium]